MAYCILTNTLRGIDSLEVREQKYLNNHKGNEMSPKYRLALTVCEERYAMENL